MQSHDCRHLLTIAQLHLHRTIIIILLGGLFFFCIAAISKIISIVYYYLLLDIPTFSRNLFVLFQWFLVSFHGFSNKFLQPNVPATQQPPIKDTKVKPKQEPPQTP